MLFDCTVTLGPQRSFSFIQLKQSFLPRRSLYALKTRSLLDICIHYFLSKSAENFPWRLISWGEEVDGVCFLHELGHQNWVKGSWPMLLSPKTTTVCLVSAFLVSYG